MFIERNDRALTTVEWQPKTTYHSARSDTCTKLTPRSWEWSISRKLVDEPITIHCIFILSSINSCLNQDSNPLFLACYSSLRWCTTNLVWLQKGSEDIVQTNINWNSLCLLQPWPWRHHTVFSFYCLQVIKVPSFDKGSPLKSKSRSEHSHACFIYCQEFLPCPNFSPPSPFTFISTKSSLPCFLTELVLANKISHVGQ